MDRQRGETLQEALHASRATGHEAAPHYASRTTDDDVGTFAQTSAWDPNMDDSKLKEVSLTENDLEKELKYEQDLGENSPYPEVRAAVDNTDDISMPANTLRAWFLGLLFVTLGSGLNIFFSLRDPNISVGPLVVQLCAYPVGKLMEFVLPRRVFNLFGLKFSLNPGPFNRKEHALITIMANVAFANGQTAYSTLTVEAQRGFYGMDWGFGFAIMFTLTTQMIGLGVAGVCQRYLVKPASMIWPANLPNCALFSTLHDKTEFPDPENTSGWSISRFRFFLYVLVGGIFWYWLPGYLWQGLSVIAWVTWIKPKDPLVNQLFGGFGGYSFGAPFTVFTLDWTQVNGFLGSPLTVPWSAIGNTLLGLVCFTWIVSSGVHYSNAWYNKYLTVSDSRSYDRFQQSYDVHKILTNMTFDQQKYSEYSPIYLSTTFALQYGLSFATIVATVFHVGLWHGPEIVSRTKGSTTEPKDVHEKMYEKYPQVPMWWFYAMFAAFTAIGLGTILAYPLELPVWAYFLALLMAVVFIVPIGIIQAITNISIGLNVITEFVVAYMLPGRPMAMMAFKTIGYITMSQGITYAQDQKLGLYMKVPPRTLFFGQLVASVWSCFVQIGVLLWAFANVKGICTDDQPQNFTCPNGLVFFNASIIWGAIGPSRMFTKDSPYNKLYIFFLVGAIAPVLFWAVAKKFPRSGFRHLHAPVIFGGLGLIPPATPMNYLMWGTVGFVFNKWIRSRMRGWWYKYNYVLSASLDTGLAIGTTMVFFAVLFPQVTAPKWWGNTVVTSTLDYHKKAMQVVLPEGEYFGPPPGSWS